MKKLAPRKNGTLLLNQLDIPGRTWPLPGSLSKSTLKSKSRQIWGINIAAAQDNFPLHGLLCRVKPWEQMKEGDLLKIFWGTNQHVVKTTVGSGQAGKVLELFVPSMRITEGSASIYYSVERPGQPVELSEKMEVLVKLTRPGGRDDENAPGHSKLIMQIPQDILDKGINAENVAKGVDITIVRYPYMAPGDSFRVSWGGVFVFSNPLTPEQADGTTPITVHISEATILEAGDSDSNGLSITFEAYDQVQNCSEDWSREQRVVVNVHSAHILPHP